MKSLWKKKWLPVELWEHCLRKAPSWPHLLLQKFHYMIVIMGIKVSGIFAQVILTLVFFKHVKLVPVSGFLYLLFPLSETLFPWFTHSSSARQDQPFCCADQGTSEVVNMQSQGTTTSHTWHQPSWEGHRTGTKSRLPKRSPACPSSAVGDLAVALGPPTTLGQGEEIHLKRGGSFPGLKASCPRPNNSRNKFMGVSYKVPSTTCLL